MIDQLIARKAAAYLQYVRQQLVIFPGVREFVREAATRAHLAICSGALRHEIELILGEAGIRAEFEHITSSEDVTHGKPNPEGFLHALHSLNQRRAGTELMPDDCLVIEDSIPGIRGGHAAGMKVLAVANTHPIQELQEAEFVTRSLSDVTLADLERRLWKSEE